MGKYPYTKHLMNLIELFIGRFNKRPQTVAYEKFPIYFSIEKSKTYHTFQTY